VTSSLAVFDAAIWVKSFIMIECQKNMEIKEILHKSSSLKYRVEMEFTAC